ncbi:hypothetical protein [uncultured Nocardioides sp.]|uniref:hypothetical protein n=1 Tax=uncultured Nocardioides sp. TaxID=198441 RepID=UPI000C4EC25E|nr:hypothetical protein [uncultured Nocardioides sp.]MAO80548.1 hypothetical protein [Nocardioides sp.]
MNVDGEQARESQLLATVVDPLVRAINEAAEHWDAYRAAVGIGDSFVDEMDWMPHGGSLYATWAELTDLFDTGKTPLADAHRVLTQAATAWLDRSGEPSPEFLAAWLERAQDSISALVRQDGDFWPDPAS